MVLSYTLAGAPAAWERRPERQFSWGLPGRPARAAGVPRIGRGAVQCPGRAGRGPSGPATAVRAALSPGAAAPEIGHDWGQGGHTRASARRKRTARLVVIGAWGRAGTA
ncbi:hypothetical protein NDU88_005749 [Pleurodeles waltl]|uniref:Uncharacterized protein n=1 Tax=Pleurodeles waltl TaxID=8319 RepID=A0AAV7N589_PLEWA|nr:hypothetical protein NDU88_005749 [Pleurodeles waltl]